MEVGPMRVETQRGGGSQRVSLRVRVCKPLLSLDVTTQQIIFLGFYHAP